MTSRKYLLFERDAQVMVVGMEERLQILFPLTLNAENSGNGGLHCFCYLVNLLQSSSYLNVAVIFFLYTLIDQCPKKYFIKICPSRKLLCQKYHCCARMDIGWVKKGSCELFSLAIFK